MPNWKSKPKSWAPVRSRDTQVLEAQARELRKAGAPAKEIAVLLGRSKSRIYEYLRRV